MSAPQVQGGVASLQENILWTYIMCDKFSSQMLKEKCLGDKVQNMAGDVEDLTKLWQTDLKD
jgi:hypothetical protein